MGFRANVKLVLEPGSSARIVDDAGHRTLSLTPTEGQIVALMGADSTVQSLATAAQGAGLKVEPPQVEALLARLKANGFIDYTPTPEAGKRGPTVLLPDDVVPAFRSDLKVGPAERPGLALVTDAKRNRSFTLYDFEVHIARLLDGRHKVTEVIEKAGKIGIPVTPESLAKFVGQMQAYGFLAEPAPKADGAPAEESPWSARGKWSPDVREMYQSALRLFRQGRPKHALEYLDALLEMQPDTPEAVQLKKRVKAHLEAGPATELNFEDLHGIEEPLPDVEAAAPLLTSEPEPGQARRTAASRAVEPAKRLTQETAVIAPHAAGLAAADAASLATPSQGPASPGIDAAAPAELDAAAEPATVVGPEPATADSAPEPAPAPRPAGRRRSPLVALAGAAALLLALAFPVPAVQRTEATLEAVVLAEPKTPKGTFEALKVKSGTPVQAGTVLATFDAAGPAAEIKTLEAKAEQLDAAASVALSKKSAANLKRTKAQLARAKKELAKSRAKLAKAKGAATARAELEVAKNETWVEAAEKALETANDAERVKTLQAEAAEARAHASALQQQLGNTQVTAPTAGLFVLADEPPAGAQFDEGTPFGRIVDDRAALLRGAVPDSATVVVQGKRLAAAALPKRAGGGMVVPLDPGVRPASAQVEVTGGLRPWPLVKLK